jgi:hypothetical protein
MNKAILNVCHFIGKNRESLIIGFNRLELRLNHGTVPNKVHSQKSYKILKLF